MKIQNTRIIFKTIILLLSSFLLINTTYSYEVKDVEIKNDKTIEISLDDGVEFTQGDITGDIKILEDSTLFNSSKDFEELNKVIITLDNDFKVNSTYSLLSIFGADGSIDFEVGEEFLGTELINPEKIDSSEQGIIKVIIKDSKTLEVYFNEDLEGEEFEFKLLREIKLDGLSSIGENKLIIKMFDILDISTDYMLVIVSLKDNSGLELSFDEDIFDFTTDDILVKSGSDIVTGGGEVDNLNSAGDEIAIEDNENFINNIALNVTETPDTGAETWVLIFGTLFINTFYYFSRRKSVKA